MANYRIIAASVLTFIVSFYFFLLPWIMSSFNALKNTFADYYIKLLYKFKVVATILIVMTVLYFIIVIAKGFGWAKLKQRLLNIWYSITKKNKISKEEADTFLRTHYPLHKVFMIASEMLSTEEQYVNVLKIIEESFHVRVETVILFSPVILRHLFVQYFAKFFL